MWKINYNLKKLIPPKKEGYRYIKSLKLYIPFRDIGLRVLVRKEQELPLFYEVILKLVSLDINNITEISGLLGVDEDILNNVVGEMSRNELIYPKSNNLLLTPKGKYALNNLNEVTIEKDNLNNIYINCISGEIADLDNVSHKPSDDNPCLDEIIKIDNDYIHKSFSKLNDFYMKKQELYEMFNYTEKVKNEIYEILEKEYEKLCYMQKNIYVYENIRDKDIIFECEDDSENLYGALFSKQIFNSTGARRFFKRYSNVKKYLNNELVEDELKEVREQNTNLLIENVLLQGSNNENIEKYYFRDRYLLEKEYREILLLLKDIKPYEIVIVSDNLKSILNYNVIALLQIMLDRCKVRIIADEKEWNIDKLKNKLMNHKQKKKNQIKWDFSKNINRTEILLYPYAFINIDYVPIKLEADYLVKEVAKITFHEKKIEEQRKRLLDIVL